MGGDQSRIRRLVIGLFVVCCALSCSDDGLDGPDRIEYDAVNAVTMNVERGEVTVFGSAGVGSGAVVDEWTSSTADFSELTQRVTGEELFIDAACDGSAICRVRYDLAVPRSTSINAVVGDGSLHMIKLATSITARVDSGSLTAAGLRAEFVDATVESGTMRLKFVEAPRDLRLRLGEDASASVVLPDETYICDFDEEGENLRLAGLDCFHISRHTIRIEPADANVRFAVQREDQ